MQRTTPRSKPPSQIAHLPFSRGIYHFHSSSLSSNGAERTPMHSPVRSTSPFFSGVLNRSFLINDKTRLLKFVVPWRIRNFYCPLLTEKKPFVLCFYFSLSRPLSHISGRTEYFATGLFLGSTALRWSSPVVWALGSGFGLRKPLMPRTLPVCQGQAHRHPRIHQNQEQE